MKTYIALLRGINVSGHRIIKMEMLRKVLLELGFENIRTYIQSGNILFESKSSDIQSLEIQIVKLIEKHFGFDVPVIIVTLNDLKKVVEKNPFSAHTLTDPVQPYVAFLSEKPTIETLEALKAIDFGKDQFVPIDKTLYLLYGDGAGNTKLSNLIIESKLKLKSTARNWKTINKLISLAEI